MPLRRPRQSGPHVRHLEVGHAGGRQRGHPLTHHGNRAATHRVRDKLGPVPMPARQRKEKHTRSHAPAIDRQPRDRPFAQTLRGKDFLAAHIIRQTRHLPETLRGGGRRPGGAARRRQPSEGMDQGVVAGQVSDHL